MKKSPITTHILDLGQGCPAAGVSAVLETDQGGSWQLLASSRTDSDGRITDWFDDAISPGIHRLRFDTAEYFRKRGLETFYPEVTLCFNVTTTDSHYHVPLLLNQWGYSTYRGS